VRLIIWQKRWRSLSELIPGVRAIEHTADLAMEVEAASLPELFERAAAGMFELIGAGEREPGDLPAEGGLVTRDLRLDLTDLPSALVAWLRELLYLHQVEQLAYGSAEFGRACDDAVLPVRVHAYAAPPTAVREIKGVTYHQLDVSRRDGLWYARVVFDV
jgi:SHS2 domain-containing protein